jgi:hypothetical protein
MNALLRCIGAAKGLKKLIQVPIKHIPKELNPVSTTIIVVCPNAVQKRMRVKYQCSFVTTCSKIIFELPLKIQEN